MRKLFTFLLTMVVAMVANAAILSNLVRSLRALLTLMARHLRLSTRPNKKLFLAPVLRIWVTTCIQMRL